MYLLVDAFLCVCSPDCCISKNLSLLVETSRNGSSLPPLLLWFSVPACRLSACGEAREAGKLEMRRTFRGWRSTRSRNLLRVQGTDLHGVRAGLAEKIKQKCVFSCFLIEWGVAQGLRCLFISSTSPQTPAFLHLNIILLCWNWSDTITSLHWRCLPALNQHWALFAHVIMRLIVHLLTPFVRHSFICCDFTAFLTLETNFKSMQLHETFVCSFHSSSFFL